MKFISIEPFIPSGSDFEGSKQLFLALGFMINWEAEGYVGFERDGCKFILQKYNNGEFASNLMISVRISSADEFWQQLNQLPPQQKNAIRIKEPTKQPYGIEVNLIDLAGVC